MMLLVTPSRKAPEGLIGYALRVAEANGYDTPWHVFSMADLEPGQMTSAGFPVKKLTAILGREPDELEDVAYRRKDTKEYQLLGHSLGQCLNYQPLRLKRPAICPQCVEELQYIEAFWDLKFAVACPHHGTLPVDACPACGSPLSWFRPGLLRCKCGTHLGGILPKAASPAIVELMRLLFAKVHGQSSSPESGRLLPTEKLQGLSLKALLDIIGALGAYATSVSGADGPFGAHDVVDAAAETLRSWPNGYYALLRRLDKRQDAQGSGTISLRKRFEHFYVSMFKQASNASEFTFLWDEFVRFGLQEWGDGVVDRRLTKELEIPPRFVSKIELAEAIGVDPRTLGKWAALGKISLSGVSIGKSGMRYIGDLATVQIPQEATGRNLQIREAAQLLGLPVSVLRSLKRSGHYGVKHMPVHKRGFHEADLHNMTQTLLGKSGLVAKESVPKDALSLNYVMQELRFWSEEGKAKVIAGYLDCEINSVGRLDNTIGTIHFANGDINFLAKKGRADASQDTISKKEAAAWIRCDFGAVQGLADIGHLVAIPGRSRTRITRDSVEKFVSSYLSLAGLADDLATTELKLKHLCESLSIEVMSVAKTNSYRSGFVSPVIKEALAKALTDSRPRRRPTNIELFVKYLERLRQKGEPLPRKGNAPNQVAIAKACGFERSAFYKNKLVVQALQEFDDEDVTRHALHPNITPFELLGRYLEQLRQSRTPIPCCNGKPNKIAIARAAGFKRDVLYTDPAFDRLLKFDLHGNIPPYASRASDLKPPSEN